MKKNKIGKIFRKISAFVLACGMVATSVGTGTISSYAADSTDKEKIKIIISFILFVIKYIIGGK